MVGEDGHEGLYAVMTLVPDWTDARGVMVSTPPPDAPIPPVDE